MANLMVSFNFIPDPPQLPWQRNLGQNGYNRKFLGYFFPDTVYLFNPFRHLMTTNKQETNKQKTETKYNNK